MPAWIIKYLGLKMIKALVVKAAKAFVKDYIVDEAIDKAGDALSAMAKSTTFTDIDDKMAGDFVNNKAAIKAYIKERI